MPSPTAEPDCSSTKKTLIFCKNADDNWVAGCTSIFFWFMNRFFNHARFSMNMSASLNGTGIMFSLETIEKIGFDTCTLTEDQEFTGICALNGVKIFDEVIRLADYGRDEINKLGGYYAYSKERTNGDTFFAFDTTKLSVFTRNIGLTGVEVYDLLRDEYGIQIEFGDLGNFLAVISVGDRERELERLVSALSEIKRRYSKDPYGLLDHEYIHPTVDMTPQSAFYADKISLPIAECAGRIAAESVMCYPPGIPIVAPGERITKEIIDYIVYAKNKGSFMTGTEDIAVNEICVVKGR